MSSENEKRKIRVVRKIIKRREEEEGKKISGGEVGEVGKIRVAK